MGDGWLIKYPKIRRLGHEENLRIWNSIVFVEEKVDGANFRFGVDDNGKLHFGTRNVELTNVPEEQYPKRFRRAIEYVKELAPKLTRGYIYFAECMIPHTIQYDWDNVPILVGFDIYDTHNKQFLSYEEKLEEFERICIEIVPLVIVLENKPDVEQLNNIIPKSKYYNGMAEGVVFKNYTLGVFAKLVAERFKEHNTMVFGASKKKNIKDETKKIFEMYFTPARIEKVIWKLHDVGHPLNMIMMKYLIREVIKDVVEEEGFTIFMKSKYVDLYKLRKLISKRCVNVLQRVIAEQSLLGDE